MTEKSQNVIDKIKASAFPALIAVVVFFLIKYYSQQDKMIDTLQDVKTETIKINGVINNLEFKYNQQEKALDRTQHRLDNYEHRLIKDSGKDRE